MLFAAAVLSWLVWLLGGCGSPPAEDKSVEGFALVESVDKGSIRMSVSLAFEKISVLDTQKLNIHIEAPRHLQLDIPDFETRLEDFRLVPWKAHSREERGDVTHIDRNYAFELYESGKQVVPPFVVRYTSPGGGDEGFSGSVQTPPLYFEILPVEQEDLWGRDLKPAVGLERPRPFPWVYLMAAVAAGLVAMVVAATFWQRWRERRDKPGPPPTPPDRLAYLELQALVERHGRGEIDTVQFCAECSNVLRCYIERRYALRAPEKTTEEFLEDLHDHAALQTHRKLLQRYLEHIDLVKFAGVNASEEDLRQGFEFIQDFVAKTSPSSQAETGGAGS